MTHTLIPSRIVNRRIHMNGRIYDPKLGRMLSPDPATQAPENGQNYNRYSYAYNNPLKYADPSGFTNNEIGEGRRWNNGEISWPFLDNKVMRNPFRGDPSKVRWREANLAAGLMGNGESIVLAEVGDGHTADSGDPNAPSPVVGLSPFEAAENTIQGAIDSGELDPNKVFTGEGAIDAAAKEALGVLHDISVENRLELGGLVVKNGDGYSYTRPTVGAAASITLDGTGASAGFHTHPGNTPGFSNSYSNQGRRGDVGWVAHWGIPLYNSSHDGNQLNIRICRPHAASCSTATPLRRSSRGEVR